MSDPLLTCQNGTCVPIADGGAGANDVADAATEAGTPPSCAPGGPGMTNCGPGGSGTESCCTSLEVNGGTFYRTYDLAWDARYFSGVVTDDGGPAEEADPATVSTFRLDKYLVTVGRFRQFVNAALLPDGGIGWRPVPGTGKHSHLNGGQGLLDVGAPADAGIVYEPGWVAADDRFILVTNTDLSDYNSTWTNTVGARENLPMTDVDWQEAYAFCIWDGGFLPSEAEWEYAAAGGSQQREYPWGWTDPGTANEYAIYSCLYPSPGAPCAGVTNVAPVGSATLGAGRWGQLDLAGEVWEWNLDWYAPYAASTDGADLTAISIRGGPADGGASDSGPEIISPRVARGGSYDDDSSFNLIYLLAPNRNYGYPYAASVTFGFRCARAP